ncbi:hypothetical protein [Azospirillum palustre]
MTITATSSGPALIGDLRDQFKSGFAAARKAFQETGHIVGVSQSFTSADGNVTISLSGRKLNDGREVLESRYSIDGTEGATLGKTLTGGIDDLTGLPYSPDTEYGGRGGSGANVIGSLDDIDAFEKNIVDGALESQDEVDSHLTSWVINGKTFSSREEFRAYNRVEAVGRKAADTLMSKLTFKSLNDESEFYAKLNKGISKLLHDGNPDDLFDALKDVPTDQLAKAAKALTGSDPSNKRIGKTLNDYIDARKAHDASKGTTPMQSLNLLV